MPLERIEPVKLPIDVYLPGEYDEYMQAAFGRSKDDFEYELGGVGKVSVEKDGTILIGQPVILEQEVSKGECEFHAKICDWLASWCPKALEQQMPAINYYTFHSHNSMGTFRSGQDDDWVSNYVNKGFLLTLIGNHKGEWKCWVDTMIHVSGMWVQVQVPCKLHVYHGYDGVAEQAIKDRKKLVTVPKYVNVTSGVGGRWNKRGKWIKGSHRGGTSSLLALANHSQGRLHGAQDTPPSMSGLVSDQPPYGNLDSEEFGFIADTMREEKEDTEDLIDDIEPEDSDTKFTSPSPFPHGDTIITLAKKHGKGLRVYFVTGEAPPYLISVRCNKRTMYTVIMDAALTEDILDLFQMSASELSTMIGSGCAISPRKGSRGGYKRINYKPVN